LEIACRGDGNISGEVNGRFHGLVQVFWFEGEGEERDAVNGNFRVIGGWFEICEWVWVEFEKGGEVLGERGKVWLECGGRGGGVRSEGDCPVLVDCSCEGQG
jgi:hypothetical protein